MRTISIGNTILAALGLMASACGGSPTAGSAQGGTFTADLSGIVTTQLNGFAGSQGQAGVFWVLQLTDTIVDNHITMTTEASGLPTPNTYPLVDATTSRNGGAPANHYVGAVTLSDSLLPGDGFDILSGTLTITQASATSVTGSFSLTAAHSSNPSAVLTVTGTFRSTNQGT